MDIRLIVVGKPHKDLESISPELVIPTAVPTLRSSWIHRYSVLLRPYGFEVPSSHPKLYFTMYLVDKKYVGTDMDSSL